MNIKQIAELIEYGNPRARCEICAEMSQIIVRFTNRPGVEIAALSPYYQNALRSGKLSVSEIAPLLFEIKEISSLN